jgi:hypothetical protein
MTCRFCGDTMLETPYVSKSVTVNMRFEEDECNACRQDDESEFSGVDVSDLFDAVDQAFILDEDPADYAEDSER